MEPYWMTEFEVILLKVASNPSSLVCIDELRLFYKKFENTEEYKKVRFNSECLISTIYSHNGFLEKSFEIDLRLLQENDLETRGYWSLIEQATKNSYSLNRTPEIIQYAYEFLKTPDDSFGKKQIVLHWYAKIFAQKENNFFEDFEPIVKNMELFVEEKISKDVPFFKRIDYLKRKYFKALSELNLFELEYSKADKLQKNKLVEEYFKTKPLKFYRDRLKQYYNLIDTND